MDRFSVKPQRHSDRYPYDEGYAVWDAAEGRQCGWYVDKSRAEGRAAERNGQPPPPPAAPQGEAAAPQRREPPRAAPAAPRRGVRPLIRRMAAEGRSEADVKAAILAGGYAALPERLFKAHYRDGKEAIR